MQSPSSGLLRYYSSLFSLDSLTCDLSADLIDAAHESEVTSVSFSFYELMKISWSDARYLWPLFSRQSRETKPEAARSRSLNF